MATTIFGFPELESAQNQKYLTVNQSLQRIDAMINLTVFNRTVTAPPVSPGEGHRYIVAATATGAFSGKENQVAVFIGSNWIFFMPSEGWLAYDQGADEGIRFNGTSWVLSGVGASELSDGTVLVLGINTGADTTNRLAVKTDAALFSHDDVTPGTGDIRFTLNKSSAGNDASFIFQDGFSARAMFGLLADNDFTIKVSPDGSAYFSAVVIDKDNGKVSFPCMSSVSAYLNYDHFAATTYVNTDINVENLDTLNSFSSGVFTTPSTGLYRVGYTIGFTINGVNTPTSMHGRLLKNGTDEIMPTATRSANNAADSGKIVLCAVSVLSLTAGDTLRMQHKFSLLDGYASANITGLWIEQIT